MRKILFYISLPVIILTQQACNKELNALPENSRVDAVAITDAKSAESALNGVYYAFANGSPAKTNWEYNVLFPSTLAGYLNNGTGPFTFSEDNIISSTHSFADVFWTSSYNLINAANGMLQGIEKLEDNVFSGNRKKEIIGETRFLRAYAHFKLLSYYGEWFKPNSPNGALLRDEPSTKANISKKRSTVQESYAFILEDLDDAIANGPETRPSHYATKWAAMLLKMRVLMSRGGTGDYAAIIDLADDIIQNSPYELELSTKDIFHTKGLASNEVILGIKPQANQESDFYAVSNKYSIGFTVATETLKNLLANDPRDTWVVGGVAPYVMYSPNTFRFTKYLEAGEIPSTISETFYAMRLSEVYLLKAEAIVRSGGSLTDAKTAVKEVMTRADVSDFSAVDNANTSNDLLLQIYYETVKSLVGEDGQDWLALLRLDFNTVKLIRPTIIKQEQYILAIPHNEFVYNPAIGDQNPGYEK